MTPLISVIIPCYNQEPYIAEALDSVIAQTYSNWECIIVDDGSTDGSAKIIRQYEKDHNGKIRLICQQNAGPSTARNHGAREARGKYLLFLDGDDKIGDKYIETGTRYMEAHPDYTLFYTNTVFFGGAEGVFDIHYSTYEDLLFNNSIACCCIVHKEDFERIGGFDEKLRGYEDWEFFIRLLYQSDNVYQCPDTLFYYRKNVNENSVNAKAKERHGQLVNYIFEKNKDIYINTVGTPHQAYFNAWLYKKELDNILRSNAYRIGKGILSPLRWIKKYF